MEVEVLSWLELTAVTGSPQRARRLVHEGW